MLVKIHDIKNQKTRYVYWNETMVLRKLNVFNNFLYNDLTFLYKLNIKYIYK